MEIRDAVPADLPAINAIYNEVLRCSTAIYADQPMTPDERQQWYEQRLAKGFPLLVVCIDGEVAGFASCADFRLWPGYRYTVEGTIHIHAEHRRHGVGRALLDALLESARALGKHMMIAGVDAENTASLAFLKGYGFIEAGLLREVGFKFGRFLDLHLLQFRL